MAKKNSILDCEREQMKKWERIRIPHRFRQIGIWLAILALTALLANKLTVDLPWIKGVAKYGILIGLLMVSLSRELIEDELIVKLRMQSYSFAFLAAVGYTLALPLLDYTVDVIRQTGDATISDNSGFVVLWMLLTIQVCYFEVQKKLFA